MDFAELAKEELIFPSVEFEDNVGVIRFLASKLIEKGVVKADFADAVAEREKGFPTGLQVGEINVAIPHTDAKYVNAAGMAVATLKRPVNFGKMDEPEKKIPVHVVFLLAVLDPQGYIKFLSKLARKFGDASFMSSIYSASTAKEIAKILKENLSESE